MKGKWLLTVSLLAATSLASVSADSIAFRRKVLATKDLLGYWPFESSFIDLTANANDARVVGNPAMVTFCPGVNGGQALQLDNTGSTDKGNFVEVPAPIGSIFDAPKFSVVVWAKVTKPRPNVDGDQWNCPVCRTSLWYVSLNSVEQSGSTLSQFVVSIYSPANPNSSGTDQVRDDTAGPFAKKDEWHQYRRECLFFLSQGETMVAFALEGGLGLLFGAGARFRAGGRLGFEFLNLRFGQN